MTFEAVCEEIRHHCKQYLSMNIEKPIYRGVPQRYQVAGFTHHPDDRTSKDSGAVFNFTFNVGFEAAFGEPTIRKHSIFATADYAEANQYGPPAFFFPVGQFKYAWCKDITDSYGSDSFIEGRFLDKFFERSGGSKTGSSTKFHRIFHFVLHSISPEQFLKDKEKATHLLTTAKNHFWPDCPTEDLYAEIVKALEAAFKELYVDSKDLMSAVKHHSEILFYKSSGYYLIPYEMVVEAMTADGKPGTHFNEVERYNFLLGRLGV